MNKKTNKYKNHINAVVQPEECPAKITFFYAIIGVLNWKRCKTPDEIIFKYNI